MSNLEAYAKSELERAGFFDKDSDYGGLLGEAVMKLIKVFADEGHSGMSAPLAIRIFERVARFEPLTPLTGDDSEWLEVSNAYWQNVRCSHVFKGSDGRAYDSEGKIFRAPSGACYTTRDSRVYLTFPCTPKPEYVDVKS
jgi:hypothetical protein